MPHVVFAPLTAFRIREPEMLAFGMSLPGLQARARAVSELPALGVLALAGITTEPWTCGYCDIRAADEESLTRVLNEKPDLVAVSALTASIDEAYRLCGQLRSAGIATVIGGLHVSVCPEEALQFADAVIVGRGEVVWQKLLDDVLGGTLQRRYTAAMESSPQWPLPRFDLLPALPSRFTLQTQTGCPYACGFCGASRLISRFHAKPLPMIRDELAAITRACPRALVELADDNTFAGRDDSSQLLELLGDSGVRWFTESDWHVGERPDLLRKLAGSGCQQLLVGIESLVFRYPGMGAKHAELERVMASVNAIQESGVAVNGCFIVGADGETDRSLDRLTQFLLDSPFAEIQLTLQTPFPGTALRTQLQQQGRLLEDRGWSACTLFDVAYQPDRMTVSELESGFRRVLGQVFSTDATQRRNRQRREIAARRRPTRPQGAVGSSSP